MNNVDNLMTSHRQSVLRWQRWQDFFFEKTTMVFALSTLVALTGIIISLFISSWPVLTTFGFEFFYTVEWDIINSKFGGLIAIFGTVATATIRSSRMFLLVGMNQNNLFREYNSRL